MAEAPKQVWHPRHNPWLITVSVMMAVFMEVLDTSIANIALPHIAGNLSATTDEATWVLTSYLVSNAIILPMTGWLGNYFGRKRVLISCIVMFTVASALCGLAWSLPSLIVARILQGAGGGATVPIAQAIMLESFPPQKRGQAMAVFAMGVVVAPILGPTVGGWITDNYSWRWVFYINVPVGLAALGACYALLRDPDYLTRQREELNRQPLRFDSLGLALLVIVMVSWEVMLSKGQEWDWLSDPFWRVQTLAILFTAGLAGLIVWELRSPRPVINFRPLRERNSWWKISMGTDFRIYARSPTVNIFTLPGI